MKKILLLSSLLVFILAAYGQAPQKLSKQEIETSESYSWSVPTLSKEVISVAVGMQINTVNTSDAEVAMYLYGSWDGSIPVETMDSEASYTFTQSAGVNATFETLYNATWYYPFAIIRVTATSDAQTLNYTPWIKTLEKE
jgi:hypothetical protein